MTSHTIGNFIVNLNLVYVCIKFVVLKMRHKRYMLANSTCHFIIFYVVYFLCSRQGDTGYRCRQAICTGHVVEQTED